MKSLDIRKKKICRITCNISLSFRTVTLPLLRHMLLPLRPVIASVATKQSGLTSQSYAGYSINRPFESLNFNGSNGNSQ
ncbi:MAG: hypothetical protein LBF05_06315 [Tannerella sp.]|jgi:hypothetical protein|nr:hypothetical protein [Tannerella sp.]